MNSRVCKSRLNGLSRRRRRKQRKSNRQAARQSWVGLEQLEARKLLSSVPLVEGATAFAQHSAQSVILVAAQSSTVDPVWWQQGTSVGEEPAKRWIVQLNSTAAKSVNALSSIHDMLNLDSVSGQVERGLGQKGMILLSTTSDMSDDAIRDMLMSHQDVAYAELDIAIQMQAVPNDPDFSQLYGLNNTGQTGGVFDADIDATEAWDTFTGSYDSVIAVIDTGIDYTHPDLAANIWTNPGEIAGNGLDDDGNGFVDDIHGYDFINNDGDPMDDNAHGTHVAGTIGAVGNNGVGVVGVNWNSSIMALKFLDADGSGYTSGAVAAINYATMMRTQYGINVRVTNNSWGGSGFSQSLYNAIVASSAADMLFIAAAGNSNSNNDSSPSYPASYDLDNIISVAATDAGDNLAWFSSYGKTTVDLAAPGVGVLSTVPGNGYSSFSGTSMATPHVAGVAALAFGYAPDATARQVKDAILAGVDPVSSLANITVTGGRLNAASTLLALDGNLPVPQPPAQTSIAGHVYHDSNADGNHNDNEPGIEAVNVYIDANGNGQYDNATQQFHSTDVNKPIPPDGSNNTATSILEIADFAGQISDLNVQLDITHTWNDDLDVFLISPDGTRVELFTDIGSDSDNFTNTILDDQADTSITQGSAPFTGSFRPEGSLSDFDGENAAGTWTLQIIDDFISEDSGVLNSWSLTIESSEYSTVTDAQGAWTLASLAAGNYQVGQVVPAGFSPISPEANGLHNVTIAEGQEVTGINFINQVANDPPPPNDPSRAVSMATNLTVTPGATVTTAMHIDNADEILAIELEIHYDSSLLSLSNDDIRLGSLTEGWSLQFNLDDASGVMHVALFASQDVGQVPGDILELDFHAAEDVSVGDTVLIDIVNVQINEGEIVAADPGDGLITFEPGTLHVVDFKTHDSGFGVQFNRNLNSSQLNIYDGRDQAIDISDLIITGNSVGQVQGSIIYNAQTNTLSFVATGGVLEADTYNVTLRSGSDAFMDIDGELLDGNADHLMGDDYTNSSQVVVADDARIVSLPDRSRGADQNMQVPGSATGLPIQISSAQGLLSIELTLEYDPSLLTVNSASLSQDFGDDWQISVDLSQSGQVHINASGTSPIEATGAQDLFYLDAIVPTDATYGSAHVLRIANLVLNAGQIPSRSDAAVHVAGYFGDTTGNGSYSALDAALISRVAVELDTGFDASDQIDPLIIGDLTGDGHLSGLDAAAVAGLSVGLPQDQVPNMPSNIATSTMINVVPATQNDPPTDTSRVSLAALAWTTGQAQLKTVQSSDDNQSKDDDTDGINIMIVDGDVMELVG
jgi:subtilisin family serine protease